MKLHAGLAIALLSALPEWGQTRVHPPAYRIDTVAGNPRNGDGGPAVAAQISVIRGIAIDPAGNVFLSDTDNHRVRKITPDGEISTVAGTGVAGYSGDGGPAIAARLNLPYGLAADAAGNLYIADLGNQRVRRVAKDGTIDTVAPETVLRTPRNVAVDAAGNLYISEFEGHRVRKVGTDGRVTVVAGTGVAGFSGEGGPPDKAQLAYPAGLAIDRGGALLIADSQNNRVRRIFSNGTLGTVVGASSSTAVSTPVTLAVDAAGSIYVGDASPSIRALSINGRWTDYANVETVQDLALDRFGKMYVATGPQVRIVSANRATIPFAGDMFTHVGDGGPALEALLSRPGGVAVDAAGRLAIADTGTQRIRQVTSSGTITTLASGLNAPAGVATDASGTVYFADPGNNSVGAIGTDGHVRTVASKGLSAPRGVCVSPVGGLYISDTGNGRIWRAATPLEPIASQLAAPEGCAFDAFGNLYIAETGAHRIRRLSPAGEWSTIAGTGEPGADGDESPAAAARLSFPRGVAVDDDGGVYISDTGNNRIRIVTPDGIIHSIAGTGAAGFAGDGGSATAAQLNGPAGLFLDPAGAIYFADSGNDRIRRLTPGEAPPPVTVVNAMSGSEGAIAPGELVNLSAGGIGEGVEVWFDGIAMIPIFSAPGITTVQTPYALSGQSTTRVEVRMADRVVGVADVPVVPCAPGVLWLSMNEDGTFNTENSPAPRGGLLTMIVTGEGLRDRGLPVLPVQAAIAGVNAVVEQVGAVESPGLIAVTVRVPAGFVAAGQTPATITVGTTRSNTISVWLK